MNRLIVLIYIYLKNYLFIITTKRMTKNRIYRLSLLLLLIGFNHSFAQKNLAAFEDSSYASRAIDFSFVIDIAKNKGKFQQFHYKSGELSSEGMIYENLPIGQWVSYYKNGKVKTSGIQWKNNPVGQWTFFAEDGLIQKYYQYDSTGLLHGQIQRFDTIGCLQEVIHYNHGIKDGPYKSYHQNGNIKKVAFYKDGMLDGKAFEYSEKDQTLLTEEVYRDGEKTVEAPFNRKTEDNKKTGVWRTYYDNGSVKTEANYKDGVLNGVYKEYKPNGELRLITKYVDGKEDEEAKKALNITYYRKYYDNGKIHMFGLLKDGKKNGIVREYDREGNIINGYIYTLDTLKAEGIIDKKGEYQGPWKIYYSSGEIRATGSYVDNLKDSVWTYYYRDGSVEQKGEFDGGTHVKYWRWYFKNGDLRREEYYRRGKLEGEVIEYDSTRNVIVKGNYLDGYKEGEWFYDVGDHTERGQYSMGMKTGEWKHFYPNGKLKFKGEYKDDLPYGTHIYYHENGVKSLKGKYERGLKDGAWKSYNEMGEKDHYVIYERGEEVRIDGVKVQKE